MHSLRNILVATDFSPSADAAVDTAVAIAKVGALRVTLVHVCELRTAGFQRDEDAIARCREQLDAEVLRLGDCGVEVSTLIRIGRPAEKINNAAAEVGASLIVLGRSGADGAPELGSLTDRVLRTASRSVLIVCTKELV